MSETPMSCQAWEVVGGDVIRVDGTDYSVTGTLGPRSDTGEVMITATGPTSIEHDFVMPGRARVALLVRHE